MKAILSKLKVEFSPKMKDNNAIIQVNIIFRINISLTSHILHKAIFKPLLEPASKNILKKALKSKHINLLEKTDYPLFFLPSFALRYFPV